MISRCLPLVDIAATCCAVLGVEDSYLCICSSINNMLSLQGKQGPVLVCVCVCNDAYKHTALHRSNNAGNTCWYAMKVLYVASNIWRHWRNQLFADVYQCVLFLAYFVFACTCCLFSLICGIFVMCVCSVVMVCKC